MTTYSYDEALSECLSYFQDELPAKVFLDKYALRDSNNQLLENHPKQMFVRAADEIVRIEQKKFKNPLSFMEIYEYLEDFQYIIPQGGVWYGIGNNTQYVTLSNCFAPGTKIWTTSGVKNIEDVLIGDNIITHKGTIEPVIQTHANDINDRIIYNIKCFRTPLVTVTGNHKFLSISKEQLKWNEKPQWNSIEYLRTGDYIAVPKKDEETQYKTTIDVADIIDNRFEHYGYQQTLEVFDDTVQLATEYLHVGKLLKAKKHYPINRFWDINDNFAYFLGLWLGDGCVFSCKKGKRGGGQRERLSTTNYPLRGITFTFGSHEKNLIDFVSNYGYTLFGLQPDINDNSHIDGSTQIVFHSRAVALVFSKLFGSKCDGKKLYTEANLWPESLVDKLVQGLVDSDGSVTKDGDIRVVLNNRELVESFYHLMRLYNKNIGITYSMKHGYTRLDFPKHCQYIETSNKTYRDKRIFQHSYKNESIGRTIIIDGQLFVKIDSKYKIDRPDFDKVYTLGIKDTHSYGVEGLIAQNCYVLDSPHDSYCGIHFTDQSITQISKRRGGCGVEISTLRPSKSITRNSSRTSTGPVSFAKRFSHSIREVSQNGRRGALWLGMHVCHPDILDFITCKNNLAENTGFNMTVRLPDSFMLDVENNSDYTQKWPINSKDPIIQRSFPALTVWKSIISNAWKHAEPGLQFCDTIERENLNDCYKDLGWKTVASNPCGEQLMEAHGACLLLLLNMLSYVDNPFTPKASFNRKKFYEHAQIAQRFLDDLSDLEIEKIDRIIDKIKNYDPEPDYIKDHELRIWQEVRKRRIDGRRTGLGFSALGDTLAALNIKYGSEESIEFADLSSKILKLGAYRSSVDMAKELGPFPIWNKVLEKDNPFLRRFLTDEVDLGDGTHIDGMDIYNDMQEYGRRNISCLTISPGGSMSLLTKTPSGRHGTSSGLEPVFKLSYQRRKKGNPGDAEFRVDFVDKTGDSWMHFDVHHPPLLDWAEINKKDPADPTNPWNNCCASDISWESRIRLQAALQRNIDSSISSTINLPKEISEEEVSQLYMMAWKCGLKGITIYREGSRDGVLIDKQENQPSIEQVRPRELPCDVHHITVRGQQYFVLVGKKDGQAYEVFAGKNGFLPKKIKSGKIIRKRKNYYKATFDDFEEELSPITASCSDTEEAITRLTSALLRSGADMNLIVTQLERVGQEVDIHSFAKSIARALKKYIVDGTQTGEKCPNCEAELVRQEGCHKCMSCSYSKCN